MPWTVPAERKQVPFISTLAAVQYSTLSLSICPDHKKTLIVEKLFLNNPEKYRIHFPGGGGVHIRVIPRLVRSQLDVTAHLSGVSPRGEVEKVEKMEK